MSRVIFVEESRLEETPEAFQQYVAEFFVKQTVLGKKVWFASTVLHYDYARRGCSPRGVAPSHNVDLSRFQKGLPKGVELNEWMDKAHGKTIWQVYLATDCD